MKKTIKKYWPAFVVTIIGVIAATEVAPLYGKAKNEVKKLAGKA